MPNRPEQNKLPLSNAAVGRLKDFFFELLKPHEKESVVDWVEKNVDIPTGAIPGMASMSLTPYAREILEHFGEKTVKHLVLCFGTQSSKSSIMIWGMLYRLCRDAQDAMWVLPTGDLAKSFSKSRWHKYVRSCKSALSEVPRTAKGEIDKSLFGFLEMHFFRMVLNFVGSNSPANLSSRPVGLLWMDETDKYGDEVKFEAQALKLAEERTKTYPFPLIVKASTPTTEDRMIWQEFLLTDQNYYWLTCPRQGCDIRLIFNIKTEEHGNCGVRWWRESEEESKTNGSWDMAKVKANAYYKCQCCGGEIYDWERVEMIGFGKWKPANPQAEPGRHGYHLNSLYAILSQQTSLGSIAVEFLNSCKNRRSLQNFVNSWLAEPWDEARGYMQEDVTTEEIDSVPTTATALMAVDVQENHFWVLIRVFDPPSEAFPFGQSWLVYADKVETEDEVVQLQEEYEVADENVTADMAQRPNHVGRMCIKHGWRGIWGTDTKEFRHKEADGTYIMRPFTIVLFRDPHLGTKWAGRTMDRVKYVKFSKGGVMDVVSAMRYSENKFWHVSLNVSDRYSRHMNSRAKIKRLNPKNGREEWFWKELHQENHLLDCEEHVTVNAMMRGLFVMPDETEKSKQE